MSRTRRSAWTLATALALSVVTAGTAFVTAPFLLEWLGTVRYGAYRAGLAWLGYIGLLEFGIGGALQALLAKSLGTDDRARVVAVVRAGMRAYRWAAGAMLAAAIGLAVILPGLIRLPSSLHAELWLGCALYLVVFACLPLAPFRSLAEAGQRGYLVNQWSIAQAMTAAVAALALAYAGWGLTGQFAALALAAVVFYFGTTWDGLRRYPEILSAPPRSKEISTALWALSWPTLLFNLSGRVGLVTDEIVVAAVMGPAAVASFFLTLRVIALVGTQVLAVGAASWAGLMDLHFRGERGVFNRRLEQLTRLTAILGAGGLVPVAIWNHDLIKLWVGDEQYAGALVTGLGALTVWAQALVALWGWPLMAAGLVRSYLPAIATSAAVNLAVSVAATFVVGLPGPLIGTAVAVIGLSSWWTLVLLRLHFGVPVRRLCLASLTPALLAVPYGGVWLLISKQVPTYDPGWPRWGGLLSVAGWLAVTATGYLVLAWFIAFPASDRAEWLGRFRAWRHGR